MKIQNDYSRCKYGRINFGFHYIGSNECRVCIIPIIEKPKVYLLTGKVYENWYKPLTESIQEVKKYMINLKRKVQIKRTVFNERINPHYTDRYTQDLYPNEVIKTKRKGTDGIVETVLETPEGNWWHKIKTKDNIILETGTPLGAKKYTYNPETKKYILSL